MIRTFSTCQLLIILLASCAGPMLEEVESVATNPIVERIEKEVALEALQYAEKRIGDGK